MPIIYATKPQSAMGDSLRGKQKLPKTVPLQLAKGLDAMLQDEGGDRKGEE